jgi:CHAT domain-containing protein
LLHDGRLPVLRIAALRLEDAEIAYLSACSTARPGWLNSDEPLTLAAAFQVAGYRHVIATLWPLDDEVAAQAAHRFYQLLADAPTAEPAAGALNRLTRELRLRYPDHPQAWAPLIHTGP